MTIGVPKKKLPGTKRCLALVRFWGRCGVGSLSTERKSGQGPQVNY